MYVHCTLKTYITNNKTLKVGDMRSLENAEKWLNKGLHN